MKHDLYTKVVLTVIAVCLCLLVLKETELIPKANAAAGLPAYPALKYGMVPLNEDGSVNVKITNYETMHVEIDRVNCTVPVKTSDQLDVRIREVSSGAFNYCTLPVKPASSSETFSVKLKDVEMNAFNYCTVPVKTK